MNRLFLMIGLLFILIIPQAWGATNPYANAYKDNLFNKFTDSMHTIGQTPQQAKVTKLRLHYARARKRIKSLNIARHQAWINGK